MNFIKKFLILRETLKGTKYLLSNPQVGAFAVTTKDIVTWSSILNGTKITILISSAFSLIDYFTTKDGKADFTDIAVNLLTGIGKALISYWVGVAITALIVGGATFVGSVLGVTVALPALAIFAIGATVSVIVGAVMNWLDEKYAWTKSLQEKMNELQESFNKKIDQIEEDVDNAIYKFFQDLEREFWNWVSANGGATPYDYGIRY
ncbi:hypothetical protein CPU12_09175 [Malaciobacter molluscorum LMG 25693]|uniref:Uncharacterized protein n=1 Tax=Malaciobacter molluscorum LMG 25693 TaxID=870501 RepID=A0A2G1DH42_9BACT|nr:hypothetical protein [Malaciobacter molluscorum]PHO17754.1 hypothetical protein CPU12_09175 [Malaciobacter molluscorum LMG 25693]